MAALTMAEALRAIQQPDPTLAGVVQTYAEESPILQFLRFTQGIGGKSSFNRWKTLPTSGFRALNAEFADSAGVTEKVEEDLKISGGRVLIDDAIVDRTPQAVIEQEMMQLISLARTWNYTWFKGDGTANSFTGAQARIIGDQLIDTGTAKLDLNFLDKALLALRGSDVKIMMGSDMEARINQKSRTSPNVNYIPSNFGEAISTYNGYPIANAGLTTADGEVLDFSEGTGTDESSIYVVSFDPLKGAVGSQTTAPKVKYTDANSSTGSYKVQWDSNFQFKTLRSAYRIKGITDLAI